MPSNSPDHSALKIKPSELLSPCGWAQPWPSPRQSRLAQRWGCCCQAWDHLNRNTFPQLKTGITLTSHLSAELQWFSEPEDSETHSPPRWSRNLMSCGSEHPPLRPVSLFRRVIWPWWLLLWLFHSRFYINSHTHTSLCLTCFLALSPSFAVPPARAGSWWRVSS